MCIIVNKTTLIYSFYVQGYLLYCGTVSVLFQLLLKTTTRTKFDILEGCKWYLSETETSFIFKRHTVIF